MDNIKEKALKGVTWTAAGAWSTDALSFIISLLLARLLLPSDFGIVAMAMIVTGFANVIKNIGLNAAIIQKKALTNEHLSTAFWLSITFGIFLSSMIITLSPIAANFFKEPNVKPVLKVLSIIFIIDGLYIVQHALLSRQMRFKALGTIQIIGEVIRALVAIPMAIQGFGVWSIVYGYLVSSISILVLMSIVTRWRPSFNFSLDALKDLIGFGVFVVGSDIVTFINSRFELIIVGKILGTSVLGLYNFAFRLTNFPRDSISRLFSKVMFPAFSSIQHDIKKMKSGYLKATQYISLVSFPLLFALFSLAEEFVICILGEKWQPSIIPIRILCFSGMVMSIVQPVGTILRAMKKVHYELIWNICRILITLPVLYRSTFFGINGVAYAAATVLIIALIIINSIVMRTVGINWREFLNTLNPAICSSIFMVFLIFLMKNLLEKAGISLTQILLINIMLSPLLYIFFIKMFWKDCWLDVLKTIKELFFLMKKNKLKVKNNSIAISTKNYTKS